MRVQDIKIGTRRIVVESHGHDGPSSSLLDFDEFKMSGCTKSLDVSKSQVSYWEWVLLDLVWLLSNLTGCRKTEVLRTV